MSPLFGHPFSSDAMLALTVLASCQTLAIASTRKHVRDILMPSEPPAIRKDSRRHPLKVERDGGFWR
jgi:hypothetical protein